MKKTDETEQSTTHQENGCCTNLPSSSWPSGRFNADINSDSKLVALTFDDGPNPGDTHAIIEKLAYYGREMGTIVRATFFVQGVCIDPNPYYDNPIIRAHREGHLVANHSYSHPEFSKLSREEMLNQITQTNTLITNLGVPRPNYFRAPYGDWDGGDLTSVLSELNMQPVGWDVDSVDWGNDSHQIIVKRVIEGVYARQGLSTVLFHDGPANRAKTVGMIDSIVPALLALGYKFVRVDGVGG